MQPVFTAEDNNFYLIVEKITESMFVFADIVEAIKYITANIRPSSHYELIAVGRNGEPPTINGQKAFHVIDNNVEIMYNIYLDKLDGHPYFMNGEPFHYDRHYTSSYNKCWGWIISDSFESAESFLHACMEN